MENKVYFESSPIMKAKLLAYGTSKVFDEGAVILGENVYIKAIPIVTSGTIRVMRTEEDGREKWLLFY
jgi:CRP/FNR family transcriptional regulator, anaerobic regulatory protein